MRLSFLMGDIGAWTPAHAGALAAPYPATSTPDVTAEQFTIVGLLASIGVAGAAGKWVFGWVYQAMVDDRDFWRDRALGSTGLAEIATDEAEKRAHS